MSDLVLSDKTYSIRGAVFEVYKTMGNMWHEEVYQQCLEIELNTRKIPFSSKRELPIFYKGQRLSKSYIPDLICYDQIILELKACSSINDEHRRQILNYLRMTEKHLGLLVNFGSYPKVDIERYVL